MFFGTYLRHIEQKLIEWYHRTNAEVHYFEWRPDLD